MEDGLRLPSGLRRDRNVGWDDLVIDAVCSHYGLDKTVMALPKAYKPEKRTGEEKKKGGRHGNGKKATQKTTEPATGA